MFMGMINNFIGRTGEAGRNPASLAILLTDFFLNGAGAASKQKPYFNQWKTNAR
jgi:hypothetical protein